jgi:hypothetical protein
MPRVHPEFEAGYREGYESGYNLGRGAVDFAKRDLAEKALAAIDGERLHENLDNESDRGYQQAVDDVRAAVERVLQSAGITLTSTQKEGEDDSTTRMG